MSVCLKYGGYGKIQSLDCEAVKSFGLIVRSIMLGMGSGCAAIVPVIDFIPRKEVHCFYNINDAMRRLYGNRF